MQLKYMSATIYAKQQPKPLIGDEHYPDGSVEITLNNRISWGNLNHHQVVELIKDLYNIATAMERD